MTSGKSIIIIGGGVIGLCTAYYASLKGHRVTLVERGPEQHDGCSLGNAGMVVPSHFVPLAAPGMVSYGLRMMLQPESPFYVRPRMSPELLRWGALFCRSANTAHVTQSGPVLSALNMSSRACYEELADTLPEAFGLVERGLLMLCKEEKTLEHEAALVPQALALGMEARLLNQTETADLDRGIDMDVLGSVYFPMDCHMSPSRFVASLMQDLKQRGVRFHWSTEVTGWTSAPAKIEAVSTSNGELQADEFVIAAGSWSPTLVRGIALDLPMQAGKGYSITVPNPKQQPELCSILTEARVAVTPMGASLRFAGTMEITGLDESINQRRVDGILKSIPNYFPKFAGEDYHNLPVWSGLRPCSPDGLPYVGRTGKYKNLSVAAGHAMMGLSLAPITGKIISQILSGETPEIDISMLNPDRFA